MAKEEFINERWNHIYDSTRHCHRTPKISGIYCFVEHNSYTKSKRVIYVGKSQDLSIRLKPWHKVEHVYSEQKIQFGSFLILKIMPTKDFHNKEIEYIKRLKPLFNISHNPKIKRKIIYENGQKIY